VGVKTDSSETTMRSNDLHRSRQMLLAISTEMPTTCNDAEDEYEPMRRYLHWIVWGLGTMLSSCLGLGEQPHALSFQIQKLSHRRG
jgi:hypothetical protein